MWSSKMAARWRGKDGDLNADRSNFLACNNPNELVLSRADVDDTEMDTQSCADHSILSLFEDSGVSSEGKGEVEEESETLLSALTEMLDRVGDDDGTLSPFDIVPDTKLLTLPDCSDSSVTISLAKTKKAEKEVEVFTSTSLVNLVKLMHPYCLKVHVEEDRDKLREKETLFSQEEVWRYERPSEESDEEINVVSDDEEPVKKTKRTEVKREDLKPLKSVLLNGNSPRVSPSKEKKRVSFGPIQVAPFDESLEKELNEKDVTSEAAMDPLNSTKALGNPALEPQRISSSEKSSDDADAPPLKGETKAKSLSLQQYRQLRQKRQPLVEKQGNYITKWPSVSEPPKELPPILCLQGQSQNSCGPKTVQNHPDGPRVTDPLPKPGHRTSSHRVSPSLRPSEAKPSTHQHISRLKRPRPESKTISPASLLPDATTNPKMNVPESKKSPIKKSTLVSSDPPNPVLVPLPVSQTSSPVSVQSPSETLSVNSNPQSPTHLQTTESTSSAVFLQRQTSSSLSSEEKPQVLSVSQDATSLLQEIKNKFTETPSDISSGSPTPFPASTQTVSASESNNLEPKSPRPLSPDPLPQTTCPTSTSHPTQPLSTTDARTPANKEVLPELPFSISTPKEQPPTSQDDCATSNSGIEATDLTSLLEQFEETQAKEERACENEPGLITATPSSNLQTHGHMQLDRNQPPTSPLSLTSAEPLKSPRKTLRNPPQFKTPERVDIPEPLGTEVVLSTATRRKNPPSKAIQIIDPRPLPSKKTLISTSEPSAAHICPHTYSSICSDHDYCGSVDHSLTSATQRNRPKPSSLKDMYKITNESQVTALDSSAAVERKMQTSTGQRKSASQQHSEPTRTRLETNPSTDKALRFLDFSTASADGGVSKATTAPCTLPTPPPSPPARGREKRRYRRRSPRSSDSSSSSCCSSSSSSSCSSGSRSPKRQKLHHKRSESSSCSSSPCRSISHSPPRRYRLTYSRSRYSRSRSRSWSQSRSPSRSRSPSPRICHRQWRDVCSSRESRKLRREHEIRIQKLKAIDERRVVYVGRIRRTMTHDELRERFSQFGEVECVSLHFRDRGDHYGFVTFYNMEDAFAAIDNGGKLRKPDELPFDICFGGRRQFCNSNYADLDANRDAERSPPRNKFEDLDFDSLLKQAQRGLKR